MSFRRIARRVNVCHSVISRLLEKLRQTGEVKIAAGRGRPKKTNLRGDRRLLGMAATFLVFQSAPSVVAANYGSERLT